MQEIHLVETSENMKALQRSKLEPFASPSGRVLQWHDSLDDIPGDKDKFTVVIAHEFFDALPLYLLEVGLNQLAV